MVSVTFASIIVAVISLVGAVIAASLAGYSVIWTEERKRRSSAIAILTKYQDPLLLAAAALHRKLREILNKRGRRKPLHNTVLTDYNITYPAFLVGQFFAWMHILRIESQFLSIQRTHKTKALAVAFDAIEKAWTTDEGGRFTLWRGQQSAIGELMTITDSNGQRSCIGYSEFHKRWRDNKDEFKQWFGDFIYSEDAKTRIDKVAASLETLVEELDPKGLLMAAYSTFDVERGSNAPSAHGPNAAAPELTAGSNNASRNALAAGWDNWAQVTNYVDGKSLYRSSAPNYIDKDCTQRLTPVAVAYLTDKGIDSIISFNEHPYKPDELELLRNAKINYCHLAVKDFNAPTLGQLKDAITFFDYPGQQSTLIHCGYGVGRTGTGVTALQLHATRGRKPDESEWRVETEPQYAVLRQLIKNLEEDQA